MFREHPEIRALCEVYERRRGGFLQRKRKPESSRQAPPTAAGKRTVVSEYVSRARRTRPFRAAKRRKKPMFSSLGRWKALRTVGPKPRRSTAVRITTAQSASDVKNQIGRAERAAVRKARSERVNSRSVRLIHARAAIPSVMTPERPTGQAPTPAWPASWAKKTTKVVMPQMSQEKKWGLVSPRRTEPM